MLPESFLSARGVYLCCDVVKHLIIPGYDKTSFVLCKIVIVIHNTGLIRFGLLVEGTLCIGYIYNNHIVQLKLFQI